MKKLVFCVLIVLLLCSIALADVVDFGDFTLDLDPSATVERFDKVDQQILCQIYPYPDNPSDLLAILWFDGYEDPSSIDAQQYVEQMAKATQDTLEERGITGSFSSASELTTLGELPALHCSVTCDMVSGDTETPLQISVYQSQMIVSAERMGSYMFVSTATSADHYDAIEEIVRSASFRQSQVVDFGDFSLTLDLNAAYTIIEKKDGEVFAQIHPFTDDPAASINITWNQFSMDLSTLDLDHFTSMLANQYNDPQFSEAGISLSNIATSGKRITLDGLPAMYGTISADMSFAGQSIPMYQSNISVSEELIGTYFFASTASSAEELAMMDNIIQSISFHKEKTIDVRDFSITLDMDTAYEINEADDSNLLTITPFPDDLFSRISVNWTSGTGNLSSMDLSDMDQYQTLLNTYMSFMLNDSGFNSSNVSFQFKEMTTLDGRPAMLVEAYYDLTVSGIEEHVVLPLHISMLMVPFEDVGTYTFGATSTSPDRLPALMDIINTITFHPSQTVDCGDFTIQFASDAVYQLSKKADRQNILEANPFADDPGSGVQVSWIDGYVDVSSLDLDEAVTTLQNSVLSNLRSQYLNDYQFTNTSSTLTTLGGLPALHVSTTLTIPAMLSMTVTETMVSSEDFGTYVFMAFVSPGKAEAYLNLLKTVVFDRSPIIDLGDFTMEVDPKLTIETALNDQASLRLAVLLKDNSNIAITRAAYMDLLSANLFSLELSIKASIINQFEAMGLQVKILDFSCERATFNGQQALKVTMIADMYLNNEVMQRLHYTQYSVPMKDKDVTYVFTLSAASSESQDTLLDIVRTVSFKK